MAAPITQGKDFNFFRRVNVTPAAFPANSQIEFNFRGLSSFSLINEGTQRVEYSFNGRTLHGDLMPGTDTSALFFNNRRVSYIWFRTANPGQQIRVEAWAAM